MGASPHCARVHEADSVSVFGGAVMIELGEDEGRVGDTYAFGVEAACGVELVEQVLVRHAAEEPQIANLRQPRSPISSLHTRHRSHTLHFSARMLTSKFVQKWHILYRSPFPFPLPCPSSLVKKSHRLGPGVM